MTIERTPTIERLEALPLSERDDALEQLVVAEFKATLLMSDDEELLLDESFFDAGFTSLRITEIKERLETLLGCEISTNLLFNSPTVERLLEHLTGDVLPEFFQIPA
jgi:acyl carrier protein